MPELGLRGLASTHLAPTDLVVGAGEIVGLHGASGAGKTLLLRAIADLDPNSGNVGLDGVDRNALPACRWRRMIGYLPAESAWWHDRVGDHLAEWDCDSLAVLGFAHDVLDWDCGRLSSGERQRLGLARLLSGSPAALLLDEPTANLDGENTGRVERLVVDYAAARDAPVLWVSHDPEQRARVAARSQRIEGGKLV